MVKIINGYTVDLESNIITTQAGYKIEKDVLSNVGSIYDNLKITNMILDKYEPFFTHTEAWNLACEIGKDTSVLEKQVDNYVAKYLEDKTKGTDISDDTDIDLE